MDLTNKIIGGNKSGDAIVSTVLSGHKKGYYVKKAKGKITEVEDRMEEIKSKKEKEGWM